MGVGYSNGASGQNDLPLFTLYFTGGINSVGALRTGAWDLNKADVVGGDKLAVFNAEILFPIAEQYGLRGVAFFDVGQVFNEFSMLIFAGPWASVPAGCLLSGRCE